MRIVSLNVNGLRAFDEKNNGCFNEFCLNILKADIICLQEIKGSEGSLAKYFALKDYLNFSTFHKNKGRHGVSTLVRKNLYCSKSEEIEEGRILKTHHGNFVIYNCYLPYFDETTDGDKSEVIRVYDKLKQSLDTKRTIICGDLNATYNITDHYQYYNELKGLIDIKEWATHERIQDNRDLINFTTLSHKELEKLAHSSSKSETKEVIVENKTKSESNVRKGFKAPDFAENKVLIKEKAMLFLKMKDAADEFLDDSLLCGMVEKIRPSKIELPYSFYTFEKLEGYFLSVYQRSWLKDLVVKYQDTFRMHNKKLEQFTCWNTIFNLRRINWGTRIDYILCTNDIECTNADIMPQILGSDHCPVYSDFTIEKYEDDGKNLVKRKNNLFDFLQKKK